MAEDKKRRQWLYDDETDNIVTAETSFPLSEMTQEADLFLKLYGCKQYLADVIASKGGDEFSDKERADTMQERFDNLCSDKFKLTHTESGFYFKDPDAIAASRKPSVTLDTIYDGLIEDGMTPAEACKKVTLWTGKPYAAR